jgi:hypothetical protein
VGVAGLTRFNCVEIVKVKFLGLPRSISDKL